MDTVKVTSLCSTEFNALTGVLKLRMLKTLPCFVAGERSSRLYQHVSFTVEIKR
ncbi:MAG: hypothetical protein WA902_22940 [Thermosynechococcaceae cyanobacterium]